MRKESGPYWRAILEARWRIRLQEVTELSVSYHATADTPRGVEDGQARRLLRLATEARQRLADTEEALGRLAAGGFGLCEQCATPVPHAMLTATPESRYCLRCITSAGDGAMAPGTVAGRR